MVKRLLKMFSLYAGFPAVLSSSENCENRSDDVPLRCSVAVQISQFFIPGCLFQSG